MITALKQILHAIFAPLSVPLLYTGAFFTLVTAMFKRAEWGVFVLVALIPMPNVWYKFHGYPLGKDLIDLLIFAILVGIFINKKGFNATANSGFIALFIIVNYLAVWNSSLNFGLPAPVTTENNILRDWKNYAEMLFLYFLIVNGVRDEKHQQVLVVIMAVVILVIGLREFRNFTQGAAFSYERRASGPFWVVGLGANHLGAFIAHYCALLLGLSILDENKKRRMLYLAAILFGLHPLFFSYSRGAYLAALAVVAFYGLVKKRSYLAVLAILLLFWQAVLPTTVVERIQMTETETGEIEDSAAHRLNLWNHAIGLFQNNPVFGVGYGGFGFTVAEGELTDTHNFYVKMLSEQGMIGFSLFLILLGKAFRSGWQLYQLKFSPFYSGLGLGFMGCVVACMFTNMFGDRWSYFVLGSYFFVYWGLVDRSIIIVRERARENEVLPITTPAARNAL